MAMDPISTWPVDAWYAAAWAHDVSDQPSALTVCDTPLVLYRLPNGKAAVLHDLCPHRHFPLSKGFLRGEELVCKYHGIRFNAKGGCTFAPGMAKPPSAVKVRAFPVVERHRFIWVWIGDPAKADDKLVPNLWWNDHPQWAGDGGTFHVGCDYRLVLDNLMDLTHETYVHAGSIGQEDLFSAPMKTEKGGDFVKVTRRMPGIEPPPFWRKFMIQEHGYDGACDRWQEINFSLPANIAIDVGVAKAGTGGFEGKRDQGVNMFVLNTITPETRGRSHYHWAIVRNFQTADRRISIQTRDAIENVFKEDIDVFEAQQISIDRADPGEKMALLKIDEGAVMVRRLIDQVIAAAGLKKTA